MYAYKNAKIENIPVVITLDISQNCKSNINRDYLYNQKYAKHRCNKAYVINIEDDYGNEYDIAEVFNSKTNKIVTYVKNQYISSDEYDENKENVNGKGIIIYLDKDLARNCNRVLGKQIWNNINNIYMTFYNNGCPKERIIFFYSPDEHKIINDYIEQWFDNGWKKFEKKFENDSYKIQEWYENGNKMKDYYLKGDKIDGIYTDYYINSKLKSIKQYNNGLLNGICSEWNIHGNITLESEFSNGNIVEKYKKIYKNNQEITVKRNIKLKSIYTKQDNTYKKIPPVIIPIKNISFKRTVPTVNLYDKYKNSNNIINEIKDKKELIKTNPVHYNVRNSISGRLQLKFDEKKYLEIN
jgi:antitoxin component YwqK of YwqJK toxin-antitoxin module